MVCNEIDKNFIIKLSLGDKTMSIKDLIKDISKVRGCEVYQPSGTPNTDLKLPNDLAEFYKLCGGLELFSLFKLIEKGEIEEIEHYPSVFIQPEKVLESTKIILSDEVYEEYIADDIYNNSKFKNWYTIVDLYDGNYIVIDLNIDRLGKCYLAYADNFLVAGEMPIVAESFTELLERFVKNNGEYFFFLDDSFESYGDAFDGIEELEW